MIDMNIFENVSNNLWHLRHTNDSYDAAHVLMTAILELARSQQEMQKELAWMRKKLNGEI